MLEDYILVLRSKRGDHQAFDLIYRKYLDALLTVAMTLVGNAGDAEDVVQEVFMSLVQALSTFELRSNLRSFLAVCVANRCRDLLRKRSKTVPDRTGAIPAAAVCEPLEMAICSERIGRLRAPFIRLPYEQREVIALHIHTGLTFRAMARALGVPLGTVQSRYRYGLNTLKVLLNGQDQT
jgi:RNA polymerase sigma-70 factor (ECF subfamily)